MVSITIQSVKESDIPWITELFVTRWDGEFVVSKGKKYYPKDMDGFIAYIDMQKAGLLMFRDEGDAIEIVSLDSLKEKQGVGTALIRAMTDYAKRNKKRRIWLMTTNNNVAAMRFYKQRGFIKVREYKNAVAESRKIKPSIPFVDENGTPITDEVEFEYHV
jgi:ribosomal protein S18 acetylase RimI-like enzyme